MCKTKMAVDASEPGSRPTRGSRSARSTPVPPTSSSSASASASASESSTSGTRYGSTTSAATTSSSSTYSSRTSLSSLRLSLSQNPHIYDISEIRAATNSFLAKRYSSNACWRCDLRNAETIVFQRKLRRLSAANQLRQRLALLCRSHHSSVIKLLGACVSGDHIYLVYDFVPGSSLENCLRNPRNPNFTVLSTWMSRMQVAADLASGLDYVHHKTGLGNFNLVHNHIKSSAVIVTEPSFKAKICHFGTAQLCGEVADEMDEKITDSQKKTEITEATTSSEEEGGGEKRTKMKTLTRSDSGEMQFVGARDYMSPEFSISGVATQKSDVYAFGVVILELLSGEEPLKYKYDKSAGNFTRTSVVETARAAVEGGTGRVREWVDRRLKDSFPMEVAVKMTRMALECVHVDPDMRPDMGRVAGKVSKWYIESRIWCDSLKISDQISVSLAPR